MVCSFVNLFIDAHNQQRQDQAKDENVKHTCWEYWPEPRE